jgi:hypothetical protein
MDTPPQNNQGAPPELRRRGPDEDGRPRGRRRVEEEEDEDEEDILPIPSVREELGEAPEQDNETQEEDENGGDTEEYNPEYEDNPPISLDEFDLDELASKVEDKLDELITEGEFADQEILPPLEIEPTSIINDNKEKYKYEDIVKLLQPLAPNPGDKAGPVCNEVHKLMGKDETEKTKRFQKIFTVFSEIVGEDTIQELLGTEYNADDTDYKKKILKDIAAVFYKMLLMLLGKHNADEAIDADSHVFDDTNNRKLLARHAVFHIAKIQKGDFVETLTEGIIHHPYFTAEPRYLLIIWKFILDLPAQVKVFWAQYYITTFISGYGQSLETFNPESIGPYGFIASCIGGNLEKMLFSIGMAITHFYKFERPLAETSEEELRTLKNALRYRLFQDYYANVEEELSIDSYREYIEREFASNPVLMQKYLNVLSDESFIAELQPNFLLGGRKKMRRKLTLKKFMKRKRVTRKVLNKNRNKKRIKKHTRKTNKRINKRKNTRRHKV